ncbi:MAG: Stage II sporulation protein E (SpoIIE) [Bacteroidetes bacterium HLUCCA01]|nr:MAG: Stage II sporulation protein E (SpoIIE) [Bacteroidetes bacterium HLUCCA01]
MSFRTVYIIVYIGVLGFLVYLALRPVTELHSGGAVETSRFVAIERAERVMQDFGLDSYPSYTPLVRRQQRTYLYEDLIDSLGKGTNRNPLALNRSGVPLSGWSVMYLQPYESVQTISGDQSLFDEYGLASVSFDRQMRVRSFRAHPENAAALFTADSLNAALDKVLQASGFNPDQFELLPDSQMVVVLERPVSMVPRENSEYTVTYVRRGSVSRLPERVHITYHPDIVSADDSDHEVLSPAIRVTRVFSSYTVLDLDVPVESDLSLSRIIVLFVSMLILTVLLVVVAVRLIFRGQVIWGRSLIIAGSVTVLLLVYRYLTMHYTYYPLLTPGIAGLDMLFYMAGAVVSGIFAGLAYLIWDAYARRQNHEQVPHMDALWEMNFFQRKIGKAILAAYAYAGLALGMWSLGLYASGSVYSIYDDGTGFSSVGSLFPVLTNLVNSLAYVPMVGYAFFGAVLSIMRVYIRNTIVLTVAGSSVTAVLLGFGISFVSVSGGILSGWFAFFLLSVPLVLAYRYYGILTTSIGLWIVFLVTRTGAFMGSEDPIIMTQGWILTGLLLLPFACGVVLHHFGREDLLAAGYVPEYEQKLKSQLRIEREFQIAKESQFAMMPKSSPDLEHVDVKGFFIPSFEVGGDFYDHILIKDQHGRPAELMLTVVDVSGKAMKAALTAIFTSGLLLSNARETGKDPAEVLTGINPILHSRTDAQSFITCLLARYEIQTQILHFVNAGHCQPVLKRGNQTRFISSENPRLPLGIRSEVPYKTTHLQLQSGDTLLLYSDGLPEARSKTGQLYEFDRVIRVLNSMNTQSMSAEAICEYFKQEVLDFSDYELADDMTLLVMKV